MLDDYKDVTSECGKGLKQLHSPSLIENMRNNLRRNKEEVARLEEVIELLEKNPETQRILELLGKTR